MLFEVYFVDPLRKNQILLQAETPCGEEEHPLEFTYVLSYFVRPLGKFDPEDYALSVQPIASFCSVEQFWNTYRFLRRPTGTLRLYKIWFYFFS